MMAETEDHHQQPERKKVPHIEEKKEEQQQSVEETTTSTNNNDARNNEQTNDQPISEDCDRCKSLGTRQDQIDGEKEELEKQLSALNVKLQSVNNELEREVQRRCDLEQRFTEEAKRSTDQIEELIAKSDQDDAKLAELKKRFELYSRETASMIENFTTNREVMTSQLLDLRQENDYLLGKFIGKSRELQNGEINLPQTVEELQFYCLTLNEKLILATLAKEQLEETLIQNSNG